MDISVSKISEGRLRQEAWAIAWDYLSRSGQIQNPTIANLALAKAMSDLLRRGEVNRLRLANKAIAVYEKRLADSLIEVSSA